MDPTRSTTGHAKGAVVDSTVLLGSANWSAAGMRSAWEAALVLDEPAAADYYGEALLRDWQVALSLEAPAVSQRGRQGMLAVV
jgi:phosphatidylserine/phosphatidylglycerophosphate/cardiolipin synthase-like enzyme